MKDEEIKDKLDAEKHALQRSGVEMLLYLMKHSRSEIAYPVKELSKVLDMLDKAAFKEPRESPSYSWTLLIMN